jgi:hypothetical protein
MDKVGGLEVHKDSVFSFILNKFWEDIFEKCYGTLKQPFVPKRNLNYRQTKPD